MSKHIETNSGVMEQNSTTVINENEQIENKPAKKQRGRPRMPDCLKPVFLLPNGQPRAAGKPKRGTTYKIVYIQRSEQFVPGQTKVVKEEMVTV